MKKNIGILVIGILLSMPLVVQAETVVFNPNSKIYHNTGCASAAKCKVCIKIDKQKAIKQGGRACKKCGG